MMARWFLSAVLALAPMATASSALAEDGSDAKSLSIEGNVTIDVFSNLRGGIKKGSRTLDNVSVQVNYDGAAHGLRGIKASIGALYNGKKAFSGDLVGDLQGISNIETGTEALRPYEVWVAKEFDESGSYLKLGLIDLNGTFDAPGASSLFINPSHGIVPSFAQSGLNGPSIFPTLGWAVVGEAALGAGFKLRAGVFDPVPGDPLRPDRTDLRWRKDDGLLSVLEVEQQAESWRWALGGWAYSQASSDSLARLQNGNSGFYGTVEYHLDPATTTFFRAGTAKSDLNAVDRYVGAGVVWEGPLESRPEDQFGMALAHVRTTPLARFVGLSKAETNFEMTYAAAIGGGFSLQGDVQYVLDPGVDTTTKDALVAGLRLIWEFGAD
ncbi:carbohydrate porin [Aquidulcibacter sp.]|uniref:carbohydrate porin n=1 Tax=Aquidulcibacter sp. TaxID=2052990 RepID=UPI0025C656D6|nr:carbohydrate porin [Aquidulcibacter sp.]MCA3697540.1 carbohydrate porin [Aquidulcibacter sp.]